MNIIKKKSVLVKKKKNTYYKKFVPKTKEIGNKIDAMYNLLSDNRLLEGDTTVEYIEAHDFIIKNWMNVFLIGLI